MTDSIIQESSHDFYEIEQEGKTFLSYHPDAKSLHKSHWNEIQLQPRGGFAPAAVSSRPIEFRISPGVMQKITGAYLEFTITETGAANPVTVLPAPYIFQRIDLFSGSVGKPLNQLLADATYTGLNYVSDNDIRSLGAFNALGISTTDWATVTAIAAGGTQTYSIPLLYSLLNHVDPMLITEDFIVHAVGQDNIITAGTGIPQLTNITLRLTMRDDESHEMIAKRLHVDEKKPIIMPYLDTMVVQQTFAMNPGVRTRMRLNLQGRFQALTLLLRTAVTGAGLFTYSTVSGGAATSNLEVSDGQIDIVGDDGKTRLGSGDIRPYVARALEPYEQMVENSQAPTIATYHLYFATDSKMSFFHGVDTGGLEIDNDTSIDITPGATFGAGNYVVTVIGWRYAESIQKAGRIVKFS